MGRNRWHIAVRSSVQIPDPTPAQGEIKENASSQPPKLVSNLLLQVQQKVVVLEDDDLMAFSPDQEV
jgi:hypothetical protein